MANQQAQFGFKHLGYLAGGAPDYQQSSYNILATYSTVIAFGDPVIYSTSNIIQATPALATASSVQGIFVGCTYVPNTGGPPAWSPFWPGAAATTATGYVIDAPNAKFLVAAFNTAIGTTLLGNCVNFTFGGLTAGTTGGAFSVATIDQATATSTGTTASLLPFKIVGLYPGVGNGSDPTTPYNWVVVTFNNQLYRTLTGN